MAAMTFEQWTKRFEQGLIVGTPAWQAYDSCRRKTGESCRSYESFLQRLLGNVRGDAHKPANTAKPTFPISDPRIYVLKLIYHGTLASTNAELAEKLKRYERLLEALHNLKLQTESFVSLVSQTGSKADRKDGYFAIDLAPLVHQCNSVAGLSSRAIEFLESPNVQQPDLLDGCLGLFIDLTSRYRIAPAEAAALIHLALSVHGHSAPELSYFEKDALRNGTIRKRIGSTKKKIIAIANQMAARKISLQDSPISSASLACFHNILTLLMGR